MKNENEIVLFETNDGDVKLSVPIQEETVWLYSGADDRIV